MLSRLIFAAAFGAILAGCTPVNLMVRANEADLQVALENMPAVSAFGVAEIVVDGPDLMPAVDVTTPPLVFDLTFEARKMCDQVAQRMPTQALAERSPRRVLSVRVIELEYSQLTDVGRARAVVNLKIEAALSNASDMPLRRTVESGRMKSEWFSTRSAFRPGQGEEYRENFTRVIYRALQEALAVAASD